MAKIPAGYRAIEGSARRPVEGAVALGPAPKDEVLSVTIVLRPRAPMPDLAYWQSRIQGPRRYLSVEEFAQQYGAAPDDIATVTAFATSHGLTVTDTNVAGRTVIVRGTVAQMNTAFGVTLTNYDAPLRRSRRKLATRPQPERQTYRGREGAVHLPTEVAPAVIAVLGLDNRQLGGVNIGDPPGTKTTTVPEIAKLYNFPTTSASGQTIGIFNAGGNYDPTPMTGDIAKYFAGMPAGSNTIPDIQDVPSGTNDPSLTGMALEDFEITQDILIAATVAQGAKIAVYFETNDETGWTAWATKATMPGTGDPTPSVLTSSWIFAHSDDTDAVPADVRSAVSMAFQAAAARGITIFVAQGDSGSSDGLGTDAAGRSCHVQYAGTDPWVTSCGGTTVGNITADQSSFDEIAWSDLFLGGNVATGGGVSDAIPQPDFQSAAGVNPASLNPGGTVRRGVPDIAGNASSNSGYPCTAGGIAFTAAGTSAVAPLYAGLTAVINAALGQQVGFLNPTLYALGTQLGMDIGIYPYRDITSGDNSVADGAPFYTAGTGWDACTGWGSVNGSALLDALKILTAKSCRFLVDRDHFGQDEVDGIRANTGKGVVSSAFHVIVDGFTPTDLGITDASSLSAAPVVTFSPSSGITNPAKCTTLKSDDPDFGPEVQRFRFGYDLDFGADDTAFSGNSQIVTISSTFQGLPTITAQLTLLKQPDPFITQGPDTWWLSNDIRLIQVATSDIAFGIRMGTDPFAFLSAVTAALQMGQGTAGGQSFDAATTEDSEVISVAPVTVRGSAIEKVFNFAIARVHYQGLMSQATDVRVFFRLFAANSTNTNFASGSTYARFAAYSPNYPVAPTNFDQNVIPTMGVVAGEYVSLPCFGAPRQDPTQAGAADTLPSLQSPDAFNVRTLQPTGAGPAFDTFYGCFLDINQATPALPLTPPAGNTDGPWPPSSGVALESLATSFIVNDHQCLVAEIAFDPDPITDGTAPFNSDKFAQRNISWSAVANPGIPSSRTALEPFEIRPTPASVSNDDVPDEIMIDWNNVPTGQTAEIYLPGVSASGVLAKALQLYGTQRLKLVDAHTVSCLTGGVTYIPLPKGSADGANFVGLLSVFMPYGIHKGELYTCVVRQVTNAYGTRVPTPPPPPQINAALPGSSTHGTTAIAEWRRVLGTFQVNIPVSTKEALLPREVQKLSIFKAIAEKMPTSRRWYPVFQRYLKGIGGRVAGFGGDPTKVKPSPTGLGQPGGPDTHGPGEAGTAGEPGAPESSGRGYTGKISGLRFDGFGDFEGFVLDTLEGEHEFWSREREIRTLAERAWRERLRITVRVGAHEPHRPVTIIIREPPVSFDA